MGRGIGSKLGKNRRRRKQGDKDRVAVIPVAAWF